MDIKMADQRTEYIKGNEMWQKLKDFHRKKTNGRPEDYEELLNLLRDLLLDPNSTKSICLLYPSILPAILAKIVFNDTCGYEDDAHRANCVALGKVATYRKDLLTYVLQYFERNPAPFSRINRTPKRKRKKIKTSSQITTDSLIARCTFELLKTSPNHFRSTWNWSDFYSFLKSDNPTTRRYALICFSIILEMSQVQLERHTKSLLKLSDIKDEIFEHETYYIQKEETISRQNLPKDLLDSNVEEITKHSKNITSIGGILLPIFKPPTDKKEINLVPVDTTLRNLRKLALGVSMNHCVCLEGAVGTGKTTLVEYLAEITGRNDGKSFQKVQLGEQTDAKTLLGLYRCTEIPGEFIYEPGILTEAILYGNWLLLEDIDSTSNEILSLISSLIETNTLNVPGFRDNLIPTSGFQLFLTRRLSNSRDFTTSNFLKDCYVVNVESLTKLETKQIVETSFSCLKTVAMKMVDVFWLFVDKKKETIEGRRISTRDLIKWCQRAIVDFDVSSPESALKIFQDAVDLFCCSVPDRGERLNLSVEVAHKLGIIRTKADYFMTIHKPNLTIQESTIHIGRVTLNPRKQESVRLEIQRSTFSFTRQSACLLERIACCVLQREPILLVGETGTGKTSCVQYLSRLLNQRLIVINMNQQSESSDLIGGYKPIDMKHLFSPIREEFELQFRSFFAVQPNRAFLEQLSHLHEAQNWRPLITLMRHCTCAAISRLQHQSQNNNQLEKWREILRKLEKLKLRLKSDFSLAFSFIEGSLARAVKNGDWILLDEINLANSETLECLSGLLENSKGSLTLLERGDKEFLKRHENFRLFACMNPATDVGKKELPIGLRNRFTEFFVDELTDENDLRILVESYLKDFNVPGEKLRKIVKFYLEVRKQADVNLMSGTGHKPHFSLRTLCRALMVSMRNPCSNIQRSLYESFCLSFLTQLDRKSYPIVRKMIEKAVLGDKSKEAILRSPIPKPKNGDHIDFEGYWITKGELEPEIPENYVLTETVRRNLRDLVRVVSIGKMPVLLQGDTSVGKTSLITFLAKASGHFCVRINNHEHTDLQEYVGSYVADSTGKLVFKEGVLVEAMRKGHWIILDELNLAPSDVLEALNRVLDDNRELFLPETQEVIKAHENFMLFATQNPPGLYGGRKILSRAFRNRFVELHFDEIPPEELQTILQKRCRMPESYCKQMINVMSELQLRRKSTATFAGKKGFMTLRDLFRWAERYRLAPDVGNNLYDWSQHLADEGFLVLSAKVRRHEENQEILEVLKKHLRRDVDPSNLFTLSEKTSPVTRPILQSLAEFHSPHFHHIVWTLQMRRLAVLLIKSSQFHEPVLLVGETGGGKTTICQILAEMRSSGLEIVNCHMNSEAADFLGSLRPLREEKERRETGRLFEWIDGPLLNAMKNGDVFLADEISLADDSVLERLNSLLEPERKLLVPEKSEGEPTIHADENFVFVGTMNPGGDYGKKELSPALRNRFTEVWCEVTNSHEDLAAIIHHNLHVDNEKVSQAMLGFLNWLERTEIGGKITISVRDILTWVEFINKYNVIQIGVADAFYHGASLAFVDGLGSGATGSESLVKLKEFKDSAEKFLKNEIQVTLKSQLNVNHEESIPRCKENLFGIDPFYIEKGDQNVTSMSFVFSSPTTRSNALKLLRALQLRKPILLEGSPGVGKTSLVCAVAQASGHRVLRINLSDQTDISDLFGADLPVEGGKPGEFSWRDGPFLRALKSADWILLDELNLASQSILEGLNACLDHRNEIYVPELGRTFKVDSRTKIFGCQNPLREGGARRGLPKSFLNRFTQVYVEALDDTDFRHILKNRYDELPEELLDKMIEFNERIAREAGISWGHLGAPWELNLRDVTRWCELTIDTSDPAIGADLLYVARMRTNRDKDKVREIFYEIFGEESRIPWDNYEVHVTANEILLGGEKLRRNENSSVVLENDYLILRGQKSALRNLARCVRMNWMSILIGESGSGKSSLVRLLADLSGEELKTLTVNNATDTMEILGGFEQTDYNRHFEGIFERTEKLLREVLRRDFTLENFETHERLHRLLENVRHPPEEVEEEGETKKTSSEDTRKFLRRVDELAKLISALLSLSLTLKVSLELREIEEQTKKLKEAVEEDKCLNAGGKFEWVDSLLVDCLKTGRWLLLDQVNLCSPAVLDRLNGLLEPNGNLTIGEKGVDMNGEVVTLNPHPNFRLFLAMDPRHGEISRAMRNRGVEIGLTRPRELSDSDPLDLRSLLCARGITKITHQQKFTNIHSKLSNIDVENLDVLRAALLTSCQTQRGINFADSFVNACREIYYAKTSKRYDDNDEEAEKDFLKTVKEILHENNEDVVEIDLTDLSLQSRELVWNAKVSIAGQQGFLLKNFEKLFGQESTGETFALMFHDITKPNCSNLLEHFILDFYERATVNDLHARQRFVPWYLTELRDFGETLTSEIEKFLKPNHREDEFLQTDFLRMSMLLYLRIWMPCDVDSGTWPKNPVTLKQYATMISSGKLSSRLTNEPLITNFVEIIKKSRSTVEQILHDPSFDLTYTNYLEIREQLKCLRRFEKLGNINIRENSSKMFTNLPDILASLEVHFTWLGKFFRMLQDHVTSTEMKTDLERHLEFMSTVLGVRDSNCLRRIRKKARKRLKAPNPRESEISIDVAGVRRRILRKLDFHADDFEGSYNIKEKIHFVRKQENLQLRDRMVNLIANVSRNYESAFLLEELSSIEKILLENSKHTEKNLSNLTCFDNDVEIQTWPFYELLFFTFISHFERTIANKISRDLAKECIENSVETSTEISREAFGELIGRFQRIPTIPAKLIGILKTLCSEDVNEDQKVLLFLECFVNVVGFEGIRWSNQVTTNQETQEKDEDFIQTNISTKASLLGLTLDIVLNRQGGASTFRFRSYHEQKRQLTNIKDLLWRNSAALNSPEFNVASNDVVILRFFSDYYIAAIEKSLKDTDLQDLNELDKQELETRLIEPLEKLKSLREDNFNHDRGISWLLLGYLQLFVSCDPGMIDPAKKIQLRLKYLREDLEDLDGSIFVEKLQTSLLGTDHPERLTTKLRHHETLIARIEDFASFRAVRPDNNEYAKLRESFRAFAKNVVSLETITRQIERLSNDRGIAEIKIWGNSLERFTRKHEELESGFPDLVFPVLLGISCLRHGISILIDQTSQNTQTNEQISEILHFPRIVKTREDFLKFVQPITSGNYYNLDLNSREKHELAKIALRELENLTSLDRTLKPDVSRNLNAILCRIRQTWRMQEREKEEKRREEESFYRISKKDEEKEDEEDYRRIFGNFTDLETEESSTEIFPRDSIGVIDSREIFLVHFRILRGATVDLIEPLVRRFDLLRAHLTDNTDVNKTNTSALILLIHRKLNYSTQESSYDFYKSPNVREIETIRTLLDELTMRINGYLKEWPENPILLSIHTIIDRILDFDIESPLPRFLTGLEILLEKIHQWEENAHSGVTLMNFIDLLGKKILDWRQLEASRCRDSLYVLENEMKNDTSKWWFFLFDLLEEFAQSDLRNQKRDDLEESLKTIEGQFGNSEKSCEVSQKPKKVTSDPEEDPEEDLEEDLEESKKTSKESAESSAVDFQKNLPIDLQESLQVSEIESRDFEDSPENVQNPNAQNKEKDLQNDLEEAYESSKRAEKLIETLHRFFTESPLIEFTTRLELILLFHFHFVNSSSELPAILWNVHRYYSQFASDVEKKLQALRTPAEKKLKEILTIARWKDSSFWSVKKTSEKTRRSIHKILKDLRKEYQQNVSSFLVTKSSTETSDDRPSGKTVRHVIDVERTYLIDPEYRASVGKETCHLTEEERNYFDDVSTKMSLKIVPKARKYCSKIISESRYSQFRETIDDYLRDSMEEAQKLKDLQVDKSKRSEIKSVLQRKKLALTNFFRVLKKFGFSYRLGVLKWKNRKEKIEDFTVPKVDLQIFEDFDEISLEDLKNEWRKCDVYYYGAMIKLNSLQATLKCTKNDLGAQNAERCSGFSIHQLFLAHKQKKSISTSLEVFLPLKILSENLMEFSRNPFVGDQRIFQKNFENFIDTLLVLEIGCQELVLFFKMAPGEDSEEKFVLNENASKILDGVETKCLRRIEDSLISITRMSNEQKSMKFIREFIGKSFIFHNEHFESLKKNFERIESIKENLLEVKQSCFLENYEHPITENLTSLIQKIDVTLEFYQITLKSYPTKNNEEFPDFLRETSKDEVENFNETLTMLKTEILLVIQEKFYDTKMKNEKEVEEKQETEFEENFITDGLMKNLRNDLKGLRMKRVAVILDSLLAMVGNASSKTSKYFCWLISSHAALLQQYILLVQFYLKEQISTFRLTTKFLYLQLNIFMDLASHGFCVPRDCDENEDKDSECPNKEGGMGLADGEGQRDVSDRIESEDQLEDAKNPQDQKEEDTKSENTKEEEKGIEMSENFDANLQDIEPNPEDIDSEDNRDDSDLEDEIGETGEENSKNLDEEMWNDSESEENEDENQKEESGSGKQKESEELSAREDKKVDEDAENPEKPHESNEEINEFEDRDENDDQIDPYHGKQPPEIEPEPLDLPDDLNLDDENPENQENQENSEENPFDIDEMKDSKIPEEKPEEDPKNDVTKEDETIQDSSDEEDQLNQTNDPEKNTKDPKKDDETEEKLEEKATENPEEDTKDSGEPENEFEENPEENSEEAMASFDNRSKEIDQSEEVSKSGSKDAVKSDSKNEENEEFECEMEANQKNDLGTGQSEAQEKSGHSGASNQETSTNSTNQNDESHESRRKPGKTDENRSLLDDLHPPAKKLKMSEREIDTNDEESQENQQSTHAEKIEKSETYRHVEKSERFDEIAMDAATEEQTKMASNIEDEPTNETDIEMHEDESFNEEQNPDSQPDIQKPEKLEEHKSNEKRSSKNIGKENFEKIDDLAKTETEGERVETMKVSRGYETTYHTTFPEFLDQPSVKQVWERRTEIEDMLARIARAHASSEDARAAWNSLGNLTEASARDLAEKLRLVLEPTKSTRLKGDYRTGRRINMRKIIPYIASEFRKDKIWLRRTKPSKRDYQIVLAIDDSSSMADNHSKELAFESLSLIGKALNYLEVGQLCVINFGEQVNILHPLGENFTEESGARLIQEMRFEQKKTMIGQLVDFTVRMFESQCGSYETAKLVAILSDGRGIFSEGIERVNSAVRRAKMSNIFLVFIIVDNPVNKDSILDIRMPVFEGGKLLGIRSYMDNFPFPFYIILRDLEMLPGVLSDALRQWFEIVGRIDV